MHAPCVGDRGMPSGLDVMVSSDRSDESSVPSSFPAICESFSATMSRPTSDCRRQLYAMREKFIEYSTSNVKKN